MAEGTTPQLVHREAFPDLGIKIPNEKQRLIIRQKIAECIKTLQAPSNEDGFVQAALNLFHSFGITAAPEENSWNQEALREAYQQWQIAETKRVGGGFYIDVEIHAVQNGYANIYFHRDFKPQDGIRVAPGGCSQGDTRSVKEKYLPVKNFVRALMAVSSLDENWLTNRVDDRKFGVRNILNKVRF